MRILQVLAPAEFGGLESVVRALAAGFRARGHEVRVLAILDRGAQVEHPFVSALRTDGADVRAVALPPRAYRAERTAVREAARQFMPQVLHTHGARVDVLDSTVARTLRIPTVTTVHGFTGGGLKNRLYERLQRRAMRRMDAVAAVSSPLAAELIRAGVPASNVHVLPNAWGGGDGQLSRREARKLLGMVDMGGPTLGWVGRLTREKGADVLLEAMAQEEAPRVEVVVVGSGGDEPALRRQAARLGIDDRVRWCGQVDRAGRLMSAFDLFAMSSRTEGTPIALFEAMAAGVPIVATAVGGIPDVVGNAEAILVAPDDPRALALAIRRTLEDAGAARARTAAARERLESQFGVDPWLDGYERIYRHLISGTR